MVQTDQVAGIIKKKPILAWNVADVLRWLAVIGMERYQDNFDLNNVDGPKLLELKRLDLLEIKVHALGHQKIFMSEIKKLVKQENEKKNQGKRHWSTIKPLSENTVPEQNSGAVTINLADGCYDEKKAQESFQEAVMAWRRSNLEKAEKKTMSILDDGNWKPPNDQQHTTIEKVKFYCYECYSMQRDEALFTNEEGNRFCSRICLRKHRKDKLKRSDLMKERMKKLQNY